MHGHSTAVPTTEEQPRSPFGQYGIQKAEIERFLLGEARLRGYAERMSLWFGREPRLSLLPWGQWKTTVSEENAASTWDHVAHSPCCSTEKAWRMLDYEPRYTSLEAVRESVAALIETGVIRGSS